MTREPRPRAEQAGGTTAPVKPTGEPAGEALSWAVHWVFPSPDILELGQGDTTVGRDPKSGWVLDDEKVSRNHATFAVAGASCTLRDEGSSNGVIVNREAAKERPLEDGDVIRCGDSVGVVVYAPDAAGTQRTLALSNGVPYRGSGKLKRVVEHAKLLAPLGEPVLIHAESGCGKEVLAEILHDTSGRRGKLVPINCARFQRELAASELFGHVRGAFSGADREHTGAAVAADGGTLFLDEVAELAPEVQALLLRFLATGETSPVGSTRTARSTARIVTATHKNLLAGSQAGNFRHDLYYRLCVHVLEVPPLRMRREDILDLFQEFSGRLNTGFSAGFVAELLQAEWPGNVRELKSFAARLVASHASAPLWSHHLVPRKPADEAPPPPVLDAERLKPDDWRKLYEASGYNAAELARVNGFSPTTVKRYLKLHGVTKPADESQD